MTERDQTDEQETQDQAEQSNEEFVRDIEEDPSTAGGEDEPGDELRGG